jgi:hypothetical protein
MLFQLLKYAQKHLASTDILAEGMRQSRNQRIVKQSGTQLFQCFDAAEEPHKPLYIEVGMTFLH